MTSLKRGFYWRRNPLSDWEQGTPPDPVIADIEGKWSFRTRYEILYVTKSGEHIYVPRGTNTNFRSSPFSNSIAPDAFATIVHDYLCEYQDVLGISRWKANRIYWDAMGFLNVDIPFRSIRFLATVLWYYPVQWAYHKTKKAFK